jgi:uncharacterized repeat protein (TIGR01451 family)
VNVVHSPHTRRARAGLSTSIIALVICLAVLALAVSLLLLGMPTVRAADATIFVKPAATGAGDGSTWDDATTLQDALTNRVEANAGDAIWVTTGIHTPGTTVTDTFQLVAGVAIYGGFAGGETDLSQRDPEANITVLSGDIDGDDVTDASGIVTDTANIVGANVYTVVTGADNATLDGVTITAGTATDGGTCPDACGGGMVNDGSNPTLNNVTFSGNVAILFGGGMYNVSNSPRLTNVTFFGNSASGINNSVGGGMVNVFSDPRLTNVTFSGNTATNDGGGMYNLRSNPRLTNVTFSGNQVNSEGGAMFNSMSSPRLTNVTISGNTANSEGGAMFNTGSNPTIQNSIIWGNELDDGTPSQVAGDTPTYRYSLVQGLNPSGTGNLDGTNPANDPRFIAPVDASNAPPTAGDYRLGAGSPAIDAGDNASLPADDDDLDGDGDTSETLPLDLDGNPRIVSNVVDLGAYEVPLFINKTVNNDTPAPGDIIEYTVIVTSGLETSSAIITDTLPTGLTFVPESLVIDDTPQDDTTLPTPLADGVSVTTDTEKVIIFQAEVGDLLAGTVLTNTAEVSSDEITTPITATVPITVAAAPAIEVSKAASAASVAVGAPITYTYRITNTGNLTLTAVSAADDMLGTLDVSSTLEIDEWVEATAVYTPTADDLPGPITNTVTVTGTWIYDGDTGEVSDEASASVALSGNQAPIAEDDTASTTQGAPVAIAVLDNDSDPDGDSLTISAVGTPSDGTATISGTSTIVYTPTAAFTGTSPFTYTISDGTLTDSATVTVTVTSDTTPPAAPVIGDGSATITSSSSTPTLSGTAEAGVTITLTIDLGGGASVTYETTADADGTWSIDLANDTPTDGALPEGGLAPGEYPVTVTVTDVAGNVSAPVSATLVITSGSTTLYLPLVAR